MPDEESEGGVQSYELGQHGRDSININFDTRYPTFEVNGKTVKRELYTMSLLVLNIYFLFLYLGTER